MRVKQFPESGPKRRLLDAAEALFAERGFEAVSVRDVTIRAEANVAAVNYHFGSRDELIDLLITHYANPVNEERLARLEVVEKKWHGKPPPLEEVCDAFLRPLGGTARKSRLPEPLFHKLLGRIFALPSAAFPQEARHLLQHSTNRFVRVLSKALPSLAADELEWRAHFVEGGMIHLLLGEEVMRTTATSKPAADALLGRFIRFAAAGLRDGLECEAAAGKGPQATFDF